MALAPFARARLQTVAAVAVTLALCWRAPGPGSLAALSAAVILASLAWLQPRRFVPIQRVIDRVIHGVLGALTWLLLGLIYFGLFAPVGVLRRTLGRRPFGPAFRGAVPSYLTPVSPESIGRFDRQF